MPPPVAFSRLQLAAALIEYDNDDDNPDAPYRSAQESAIFAHLMRDPTARLDSVEKSNCIGVSLPSETISHMGRESVLAKRRSRSSVETLRNPFGVDDQSEMILNEEEEEEELEVDLESWGLDAFMPKDKARLAKAKAKESAIGSTRSRLPSASHESPIVVPRRGIITSKSKSLGGALEFENISSVDRRRSFASPLELAGMEPDIILPPRRSTSRASLLPQSQSAAIAFPSGSMRSPSPGIDQAYANAHSRTYSSASLNSKNLLDDDRNERRQRNVSISTMEIPKPSEDNPFAIERPSHTSRFDPKAEDRPRLYSNASKGSRLMLEDDGMSATSGDIIPRERPYSTLDLLRPKVLVMPSPLQPVPNDDEPEPISKVRDGFELSTDGPPLPPGARSSRRISSFGNPTPNPYPPSNAFTPNPLTDLSLSQKVFRNTLHVGGQSSLMDTDLPRAMQDGEQVQLNPVDTDENLHTRAHQLLPNSARPAGKLYGKSLIDDLEARKAEMRSKQRVFKGDERPSMMARTQARSSTLIDPASFTEGGMPTAVTSHRSQDPQQNLTRRGSLSMKPLLNFNSDDKLSPRNVRPQETRSVFGVDTLWEREMEKLKEIQAREAQEEEEIRKNEAEAERKKQAKKKKHSKKDKGGPEPQMPQENVENTDIAPPTLPDIQRATARRAPPKPSDRHDVSDSDEESPPVVGPLETSWDVDSSDDSDHGPRRITGTGPRYPNRPQKVLHRALDESSEEDLPLAATVHKAMARAAFSSKQPNSDDEDKPLSQVLHKAKTRLENQNYPNESDSEDEQPLALRASRIPRPTQNADDEDDLPLAFHPQHQRRTQHQMLAQQQQMLIQAQMQNNMFMNAQASMMGGFYGATPMLNPMAMMPMQVPLSVPSPPPMVDEVNFGRVDRWRRDIVVDGDVR